MMRKIIIALLLIFSTNFFLKMYMIGKETCTCLEAKKLDYTKLNKKRYANPSGIVYDSELFSMRPNLSQKIKVSFDDEAGMRNLEKKLRLNVSRLPSNYFRNGRRSVDEDDVSEVEKRIY
jgi:hypothetical protein